MRNARVIARLDIKQEHLIKGVHLEGWRKIGNPGDHTRRYYAEGADELLYMDVVASLYGRNNLTHIVELAAHDVFVPMCVGGGVRSLEDADRLLRSGADKIAINTAAIAAPDLITRLAERFGSQAVVLSIEAKAQATGTWEAYTDNGRERTGRDVVEWAGQAAALGAGEILITSVDRDGTGRGPDVPLIKAVTEATPLPVIASGGISTPEHALAAVRDGGANAVAMAKAIHYGHVTLIDVRKHLRQAGYGVPERTLPEPSSVGTGTARQAVSGGDET